MRNKEEKIELQLKYIKEFVWETSCFQSNLVSKKAFAIENTSLGSSMLEVFRQC